MRCLTSLTLTALVYSCVAFATATNSFTALSSRAASSHMRSLRQYDFNELQGAKPNSEERNALLKQAGDAAKMLEDVIKKVKIFFANLNPAVEKVTMSADEVAAAMKKIFAKYPEGLSLSTMKQIEKVEEQRMKDLPTYSKETADGMRREIKYFPGIKVAPEKYLGSHIGRDLQRYDIDRRLLSCNVISRPKEQGGGDVLLISSSNPNKNDWLLPKGGWDLGEDIEMAAWREAMEEGGVNGKLIASLGRLDFTNKDNKNYRYYAYKMEAKTVYDDWSESMRYRIWVSYDDAIKLLGNRKEMVDIVKRAKLADELAKVGRLPKEDPRLAALDFLSVAPAAR